MLKPGDCIRVQTRTLNDVFGICFYEILEVGLRAPEKGREKEMDGVKAMMLGGSGPAARPGMTVIDSQFHIANDIKTGITEVLSKTEAQKLLAATPKQTPQDGGIGQQARPATGVMELD